MTEMNLIEKLGGYSEAKDILKIRIRAGFIDSVDELEKALLEYRREHWIFEVGDLIVLMHTNYRSDVFELSESFKEIYDEKGIAYRHATDEEIKVGERL